MNNENDKLKDHNIKFILNESWSASSIVESNNYFNCDDIKSGKCDFKCKKMRNF